MSTMISNLHGLICPTSKTLNFCNWQLDEMNEIITYDRYLLVSYRKFILFIQAKDDSTDLSTGIKVCLN